MVNGQQDKFWKFYVQSNETYFGKYTKLRNYLSAVVYMDVSH